MKELEEQVRVEKINIPQTPYNIENYLHGRCHLFAQALHEELGYEVEFFLDDDYWFEDSDFPSTVLVHAYCISPKNKCIDARGEVSRCVLEEEYEYNLVRYQRVSLQELKNEIKSKRLCEPDKGEIETLREFIRGNISEYK